MNKIKNKRMVFPRSRNIDVKHLFWAMSQMKNKQTKKTWPVGWVIWTLHLKSPRFRAQLKAFRTRTLWVRMRYTAFQPVNFYGNTMNTTIAFQTYNKVLRNLEQTWTKLSSSSWQISISKCKRLVQNRCVWDILHLVDNDILEISDPTTKFLGFFGCTRTWRCLEILVVHTSRWLAHSISPTII